MRYDYFLIWGNGLKFKTQIINEIRADNNFQIVKILHHKPKSIKKLVRAIYSYDYAPFWANRSLNHFWNAVIFLGKHKTFNGGGNDVGSHKVEFIGVGRMKYKPAKILRKTYSVQKNSLPFLIEKGEDIPEMFLNNRLSPRTRRSPRRLDCQSAETRFVRHYRNAPAVAWNTENIAAQISPN